MYIYISSHSFWFPVFPFVADDGTKEEAATVGRVPPVERKREQFAGNIT